MNRRNLLKLLAASPLCPTVLRSILPDDTLVPMPDLRRGTTYHQIPSHIKSLINRVVTKAVDSGHQPSVIVVSPDVWKALASGDTLANGLVWAYHPYKLPMEVSYHYKPGTVTVYVKLQVFPDSSTYRKIT